MKKSSDDQLQTLPGIGPRMAVALRIVGVDRPGDLVGKNTRELYERLAAQNPEFSDPCVLYVFRCAVWAAENPDETADSRLCNWWSWKDRLSPAESDAAGQ